MCCPVAASYPLCLRQPSAPSFHQQLAGLGSGGGGCPWLYPLLPMCWCPRATSSPSEHRGALGQALQCCLWDERGCQGQTRHCSMGAVPGQRRLGAARGQGGQEMSPGDVNQPWFHSTYLGLNWGRVQRERQSRGEEKEH